MWTIGQLKERGKECFRRNFWRTVLVALVVAMIGGTQGGNAIRLIFGNISWSVYGTFSGSRPSPRGTSSLDDGNLVADNGNGTVGKAFSVGGDEPYFEFDFDDDFFDDDGGYDSFDQYNWYDQPQTPPDDFVQRIRNGDVAAIGTVLAVFAIAVFVVLIFAILGVLFDIFFRNPLFVGTQRFFIHNLKEDGMAADLGFGFDREYKNQVKVMFLRDLYTFAWTLLFIIPGIYKSYEYRMVPYLMAEYPHMTKDQVFYTSKYLMKGDKGRAFLMDLSFIGWWILSGFTLGILGVFYVNPYYNSTCAALYEALKGIKGIPVYNQEQTPPPSQPITPGMMSGYGPAEGQQSFGMPEPAPAADGIPQEEGFLDDEKTNYDVPIAGEASQAEEKVEAQAPSTDEEEKPLEGFTNNSFEYDMTMKSIDNNDIFESE